MTDDQNTQSPRTAPPPVQEPPQPVAQEPPLVPRTAAVLPPRAGEPMQQGALEPVGADHPEVAPHVAYYDERSRLSSSQAEQRAVEIDAAQRKLADANKAVDEAKARWETAQKAFEEAMAARESVAKEVAALGAAPAIVPTQADLLRPGEPSVPMFFPKLVNLRIEDGRSAEYPVGIHPVPASLKDHWWLRANGVRPYEG